MTARRLVSSLCLALGAAPVLAHVPYMEGIDYSKGSPFEVKRVANTKAIYGWLQSGADVDYVDIPLVDPATLAAEVDVQVCPALAEFLPSYAILGPGLPAPVEPIPVALPPGYGALVYPNLAPGVERPTFYEPAGGHEYYEGIASTVQAAPPGRWGIIVWDPYGVGGDYVLSIGYLEKTVPSDYLLIARNLPIIRANGELHTPCTGN